MENAEEKLAAVIRGDAEKRQAKLAEVSKEFEDTRAEIQKGWDDLNKQFAQINAIFDLLEEILPGDPNDPSKLDWSKIHVPF